MATGRSREERQRLLESGVCMGRFCRQNVDPGHGAQFLELDGTWTRLCPRCARTRMEEGEPPARASADPLPTNPAVNPST